MARAYSEDLRVRVVRDVAAGAARRSVAAKYQVSVSFVIKLYQRWQQTGSHAARPHWVRRHALLSHEALVRRLIDEAGDLTLDELRAALGEHGVVISRSALDRFLTAYKITRKKEDGPRRRAAARRRRRSARSVARRAADPRRQAADLHR